MSRLLFFVNGGLGLEILSELSKDPSIVIVGVVLNSDEKRNLGYRERVQEIFNLDKTGLFIWSSDLSSSEGFITALNSAEGGISALFGHKIPSEIFLKLRLGIINLHPSLLPYGQGADPVPWALIENGQQGISIHQVDEGIDTGRVLFRKKINTDISMNAGYIYGVLCTELLQALLLILPVWRKKELLDVPQVDIKPSHHTSVELKRLRDLHFCDYPELESVLRRLQALTYADGRSPTFKSANNELWTVRVEIKKVED